MAQQTQTLPAQPSLTSAQAQEAFDRLAAYVNNRDMLTTNFPNRNRAPQPVDLAAALGQPRNDDNPQRLTGAMIDLIKERIGRLTIEDLNIANGTTARPQNRGNDTRTDQEWRQAATTRIAAFSARSADVAYVMQQIGNINGLDATLSANTRQERDNARGGLVTGLESARDDQVLMLNLLSRGINPQTLANAHREAVTAVGAENTTRQRRNPPQPALTDEQRSQLIAQQLLTRIRTVTRDNNSPFIRIFGEENAGIIAGATRTERNNQQRRGQRIRQASLDAPYTDVAMENLGEMFPPAIQQNPMIALNGLPGHSG